MHLWQYLAVSIMMDSSLSFHAVPPRQATGDDGSLKGRGSIERRLLCPFEDSVLGERAYAGL